MQEQESGGATGEDRQLPLSEVEIRLIAMVMDCHDYDRGPHDRKHPNDVPFLDLQKKLEEWLES